jgi:hypothetical protein
VHGAWEAPCCIIFHITSCVNNITHELLMCQLLCYKRKALLPVDPPSPRQAGTGGPTTLYQGALSSFYVDYRLAKPPSPEIPIRSVCTILNDQLPAY